MQYVASPGLAMVLAFNAESTVYGAVTNPALFTWNTTILAQASRSSAYLISSHPGFSVKPVWW